LSLLARWQFEGDDVIAAHGEPARREDHDSSSETSRSSAKSA
jgi:hypothetical protein